MQDVPPNSSEINVICLLKTLSEEEASPTLEQQHRRSDYSDVLNKNDF